MPRIRRVIVLMVFLGCSWMFINSVIWNQINPEENSGEIRIYARENEGIQTEINTKTTTTRHTGYNKTIKNQTYSGIWFDPPGKLIGRYVKFSDEIIKIKHKIWRDSNPKQWIISSLKMNNIIDPELTNYFESLSKLDIKTFFLKFSLNGDWDDSGDETNLLIHTYHEFAADPSICSLVKDRERVNKYYTWMPYGWIPYCTSDRKVLVTSCPLHVELLDPRGYVASAYNQGKFPSMPPTFITYISFLQDVFLGQNGSVLYYNNVIYSQTVPKHEKKFLDIENVRNVPYHNEVFSIAQMHQTNVFHIAIDSVSRIIPYIKFLLVFYKIKIHVGRDLFELSAQLLEFLGIHKNRLIEGPIRANKVYLPQGSNRGFAHLQNVQIMSHNYRQIIKNITKYPERRSVIYIRRSYRYFINEMSVERMVEKIAQKNGLKFEIYSDDPPPSLEIVMKMFSRAVLVVAPHGAGLYNMIFCEPGTYIVEVFCPRWLILTSLRLAHVLGHRFYAHYGTQKIGYVCRDGLGVDLTELESILQYYTPYASQIAH